MNSHSEMVLFLLSSLEHGFQETVVSFSSSDHHQPTKYPYASQLGNLRRGIAGCGQLLLHKAFACGMGEPSHLAIPRGKGLAVQSEIM